ncbi:MAG: preprotein translocase subunit SecA [Gemmatimonadetes bacterium]|nr:preprotein translocase subunit SecA [Gemmatimonadota bacterium]
MAIPQLVSKVFGTRFARELRRLRPIVDAIHRHEATLGAWPDAEIQRQTERFRARLGERVGAVQADVERLRAAKHGCADPDERDALDRDLLARERELARATAEMLDELLPEAFATVREACRRLLGSRLSVTGHEMTWDMVPYDVQLIGGIVLHQGKIAEMATGEGKTLVATLPAYLNALPGGGVHLVTVNNYLARRDSQWMGHIYTWLGLTVGCIDDTEPGTAERRGAYRCDITYGTNNEFGFDYLRDNMVFALEQRVQRGHVYAIIDEVDSILIDEARTPLIISGPVADDTDTKYADFNQQVGGVVRRQSEVANELMAEAERLWADGDQYGSALKAYQVRLGMPKHKRLLRYLQEQGAKKLVQRVELDHIADRKLPAREQKLRFTEETLYFVLDEKGHAVHLTDKGVETLSPQDPALFIIPDLSEEVLRIDQDETLTAAEKLTRRQQLEADYAVKSEKLNIVHQLLRAHALYEKDVEYVVQDGQIFIVDEFTGRILPGRRWSDGLHQAVEAKEGVQVKGETQTLATVTIQNYFRMHAKLAGMTGTAETEEEEFYKIYGLEVSVIPTNRPVRRIDRQDHIYRTRSEKYGAIVEEAERQHRRGLPVLVGTVSVETSETLSRMLKRRGLRHEVLNAKYHQREAEIVAQAGQPGAITIATNMAGRGTDIKLGAGVTKCRVCGITARQAPFGQVVERPDLAWAEIERLGCMTDPPCGLQIIGTERHESRRIDRQLRGRSGRQGDPGGSIFFLSLEDDLMRLFGSDRIAGLMDRLGAEEGEVITHPWVTRSIEGAQKRIELQNFQARKRLLEYDDVMNQQREVIYSLRLFALEGGEELKAEAIRMIEGAMQRPVGEATGLSRHPELWDLETLHEALVMRFLIMVPELRERGFASRDELLDTVRRHAREAFHRKIAALDDYGRGLRTIDASGRETGIDNLAEQILSQVMLRVIDEKWKDHLYDLDQLRNAITYRAWGQKDPLVEYKKEAYDMFVDLMADLRATFTEQFIKVQVSAAPPPPRQPMPRTFTGPALEGTAGGGGGGAGARAARGAAADFVAEEALEPVGPAAGRAGAQVGEPQRGLDAAGMGGGASVPKVGRNDPCPCGSGKKYKKCHGANA